MYHSVHEYDADPYLVTVTPRRFDRQMRWLHRHGWRGVTVRELLAAGPAQRRRLVGLTFDDGYADFVTEVLPVLARYRFTATVFVIAGRMGGSNEWDPNGPSKPLMTVGQVAEMAAAGMEVGSHSLTHPRLTTLDETALRWEVADSRARLGEVVGGPVRGFCYPYGDLGERERAAVADAGYDFACATKGSPVTGRLALPRTHVGDRDTAVRLYAKQARHRVTGWGRA